MNAWAEASVGDISNIGTKRLAGVPAFYYRDRSTKIDIDFKSNDAKRAKGSTCTEYSTLGKAQQL